MTAVVPVRVRYRVSFWGASPGASPHPHPARLARREPFPLSKASEACQSRRLLRREAEAGEIPRRRGMQCATARRKARLLARHDLLLRVAPLAANRQAIDQPQRQG